MFKPRAQRCNLGQLQGELERHGNNGNTHTVNCGKWWASQARGNTTMIKLESKVIRKRKKGEGGWGRKFPSVAAVAGRGLRPAGQGAACKSFCWRRKEAPRTWVAKGGVADTSDTKVLRVVPQRISLPQYCSKQKIG